MNTPLYQPEKNNFFAISGKRAFWFTFFSFGFYQFYWFYKNWQAICSSGKKVNPIIRAWIFPIFFAFPLFYRINKAISPNIAIKLCLFLAPILFVSSNLAIFIPWSNCIFLFIITIFFSFLSAFLMLFIQRSINKYLPKNVQYAKITPAEFFITFSLILIFLITIAAGSYVGHKQQKDFFDMEKPQNFMTVLTFTKLSVYPYICEQQGYKMKNYPIAFMHAYQNEIEIFEQKLREQNSNLLQEWQSLPDNIVKFIFQMTNLEMESMRRDISKKTSTNATLQDLCKMFDTQADTIFKNNLILKQSIQIKINQI